MDSLRATPDWYLVPEHLQDQLLSYEFGREQWEDVPGSRRAEILAVLDAKTDLDWAVRSLLGNDVQFCEEPKLRAINAGRAVAFGAWWEAYRSGPKGLYTLLVSDFESYRARRHVKPLEKFLKMLRKEGRRDTNGRRKDPKKRWLFDQKAWTRPAAERLRTFLASSWKAEQAQIARMSGLEMAVASLGTNSPIDVARELVATLAKVSVGGLRYKERRVRRKNV